MAMRITNLMIPTSSNPSKPTFPNMDDNYYSTQLSEVWLCNHSNKAPVLIIRIMITMGSIWRLPVEASLALISQLKR